MLRAMEPITRIPKAVVVTTYPISGSFESLLVANVHALNFTLGTTRLREQLEAVAEHGAPRAAVPSMRSRCGWSARTVATARRALALSRATRRSYVLPMAYPH